MSNSAHEIFREDAKKGQNEGQVQVVVVVQGNLHTGGSKWIFSQSSNPSNTIKAWPVTM